MEVKGITLTDFFAVALVVLTTLLILGYYYLSVNG